jgi:chromosome segregation protein
MARLEARQNSLRGEISSATGRRESGETRLHLLQNEIETATRVSAEISANLQQLTHRAEAAALALEQFRAETAASLASHERAQQERQNTESVLNAAGKEATGIESRLEILRQLQEQGEGLDEGTQAILRGLDNPSFFQSAMRGTLAQQIQVEERLIPAIEAALGAALQVVIFKDHGVAEAAIATLRGKKLGRAAVIPSEWIAPAPLPTGEVPFGVFGRAADCVKGDGEGASLARQLLGDVLIVDTLEAAFRLRLENPAFAFASLDGGFISRTGIVHGGQSGENAGQSILERKIRITELEAALTEATSRIESLIAARAASLAAMEQATDTLKHARESLQAAQIEAASVDNERRHAERQFADSEAKRASFQREVASIEDSLRSSLAQLAELEARIAETTCTFDSLRSARSESETLIQVVREKESAATESLNEIRVRVATERQQQESLHRQRGPMSARILELNELLDARRTDISNYETRIETLSSENISLQASISESTASLSTEQAHLDTLLAQRSEVGESAGAVEAALRSTRQQLTHLQDQHGRLEVKAAQAEMRMENLRNHVSQRYQTDLEAFEPDTYGLIVALRERNKRKPEPTEGEAS